MEKICYQKAFFLSFLHFLFDTATKITQNNVPNISKIKVWFYWHNEVMWRH